MFLKKCSTFKVIILVLEYLFYAHFEDAFSKLFRTRQSVQITFRCVFNIFAEVSKSAKEIIASDTDLIRAGEKEFHTLVFACHFTPKLYET